MIDTKKMLYFMKKYGEYRKATPVDLKNDKPANITIHKVKS